MFEKHREKHRDTQPKAAHVAVSQDGVNPSSNGSGLSSRVAVIGPGIRIKGDISGDENLTIEGKLNGKVKLKAHDVYIGTKGKVHADVTAKVIKIAGEVRGDMHANEKVVILATGNVHGNIIAPRMTLEDGALFKGSIDMNPSEPDKAKTAAPSTKTSLKATETATAKAADTSKVIASDKDTKGAAYTLNGS